MSDASQSDEMREALENAGSDDSHDELFEDAVSKELPNVGLHRNMAQVWSGLLGFIQQTAKMYDQSDWTEEQKAEYRYTWERRLAVDTSEREERELRVKFAQEYGDERAKQDEFRQEQLAHIKRYEAIERERTDRMVAAIERGFADVIKALKFEADDAPKAPTTEPTF